MANEVMKGEVVWFNGSLGFGFIKPEEGSKDFFVHYSNIVSEPGKYKTLTAGQKVSFTLGENNTGVQAENVVVLEEPVKASE
jgi:CspA family cold shock protein